MGFGSTSSVTKARTSMTRGRISFFIFALIGLSVLISTVLIVAIPNSSRAQNDDVSVLFIVLDEAPLFPLVRTDGTINRDRFPGFAALADSSTWYRNMVGTAQRTTEAVPAILDGKWPTFKNYPYFKDHPNNLFTLVRGKRDLHVYQAITHLCPKNLCTNASKQDEKTLDRQVLQLRESVDKAASSTQNSLHFSHVLLPHRPWGLVPDLRLVSQIQRLQDPRPISDPERRRDNYQSLLRQFVATDKLILEMVTKMKASRNWDNTLIIVTADHGITFVPGETYRDKINPKRPETLEDIYRIPLFIKYPKQNSARVNDCPASSIDLLQTVIGVTKINPDWKTEGTDLSKTCPTRSARTVRWPKGSAQLRSNFNSVLERVSFYNSWVDANGNVDDIYRSGRSGSLLGTDTPTRPISKETVTWELNRPEKFQLTGSGEFAPIVGGASGRLFNAKKICSKCEGLIAINDKFVGVATEFAGTIPQKNGKYFQSPLMTRLMQPGPARVELWIADWSKEKVILTRVGPPRTPPRTATR
jgi:hypothetical protein